MRTLKNFDSPALLRLGQLKLIVHQYDNSANLFSRCHQSLAFLYCIGQHNIVTDDLLALCTLNGMLIRTLKNFVSPVLLSIMRQYHGKPKFGHAPYSILVPILVWFLVLVLLLYFVYSFGFSFGLVVFCFII